MATLEKIRNQAGLLVIVIGVALLAFILGDFLNSGSTFWRQSQETVINVNGKKVEIQDFQKRIDEMTDVYKMQTGNQNVSEDIVSQIREAVYQTIIEEKLLEQTAEKLGLTVTTDEIMELVTGDNPVPAFQQNFVNPETGEFDKTFALNFVKAMEDDEAATATGLNPETLALQKAYWHFIKRNFINERLRTKIGTLLTKSQGVNQLEAKLSFENNKTSSSFAYIMQPYSVVADSVIQVSDADMRKLYDQRKESWKHEDERTADLLVVDIRPSTEDIEEVRKEFERAKEDFVTSDDVSDVVNRLSEYPYTDYYISENMLESDMRNFAANANIGDVEGPFMKENTYRMMKLLGKKVAPDSVKVSVIVLGDAADSANKALSDSLIGVINKGGAFGDLAREHSKDASAQQNGEMGWFTEGTAVTTIGADFRDLIFSTPVGQVKPFNFRNSLFLVMVSEKTADKAMYKVADVVMTVTPSSQTQNDLYNKLNHFLAHNKDIKTFAETATAEGYSVMPDAVVNPSSPTIHNISSTRPVVRWMFEAKKGAISEIFVCNDNLVVAGLKKISDKGYRPFDEVKEELKYEVIKEKKGEKIAADITAMGFASLDEYARNLGKRIDSVHFISFSTQRIANVGAEPKLNAAAIVLPENKVSAPIAGNSGVYLLNIYNRIENSSPFNVEAEIAKIGATRSSQMWNYQFLQILRSKSEIEDNRIRFY